MVPEQKRAWFIIGVFAVAVVCFLLLIPFVGAKRAVGGFGVFGLAGLTPILFRKKRDSNEVAEDERDKAIAEKATLGGGISSYTAVVLVCMITWAVFKNQGKEVIGIGVLPHIVGVALTVLFTVRSITILILYGRERTDGQN